LFYKVWQVLVKSLWTINQTNKIRVSHSEGHDDESVGEMFVQMPEIWFSADFLNILNDGKYIFIIMPKSLV